MMAALLIGLAGGGASATPTPTAEADLSLTKTDGPDPVFEDAVLDYAVEVRNGGPDAAANVVMSDTLPNRVRFVSADSSLGTCERQGRNVTCEIGDLAAGQLARATIEVRPRRDGQITNTASVQSDVADPQEANNEDAETTTVTPKPKSFTCRRRPATIPGTKAAETLNGTPNNDVIAARGGDDVVNAGDGNDLVCAGGDNDFVRAGFGRDVVKGQGDDDTLKGQRRADELRGNKGGDSLRGGRGGDLLGGGKGRDFCRGGKGRDELNSC
jgi:uncharacterized repeat protein (TIGR01451 family)